MKNYESTSFLGKKMLADMQKHIKGIGRKEMAHILLLVLLCLFYVLGRGFKFSDSQLLETTIDMKGYEQGLRTNLKTVHTDSIIAAKEREQLLMAIEEGIVNYLYQVPDYSYITALETYLQYRPELLRQFPSCVPLEKGDYFLSSRYGIRTHPISKKRAVHFGIDLAAPSGKPVYVSATGTVADVIRSDKGYGIHIIIRHRFGFETLYGHLEKVLVSKGQTVHQHELIGTVGSSGSSTGYHLHYEIRKNDARIDPRPSFDLKKTIYVAVMNTKPENNGE